MEFVEKLKKGEVFTFCINPCEHNDGFVDDLIKYFVEDFQVDNYVITGEGDGQKVRYHLHGLFYGGKYNKDNKIRRLKKRFPNLKRKGQGGAHILKLTKVKEEIQIYYIFKAICCNHYFSMLPCLKFKKGKEQFYTKEKLLSYREEYKRLAKTKKVKTKKCKMSLWVDYVNKHYPHFKTRYDGIKFTFLNLDEILGHLCRAADEFFKETKQTFRTSSAVERLVCYYLSETCPGTYRSMMCEVLRRRYIKED